MSDSFREEAVPYLLSFELRTHVCVCCACMWVAERAFAWP